MSAKAIVERVAALAAVAVPQGKLARP